MYGFEAGVFTYVISKFDLNSDQMIDIVQLPRASSRIPLARTPNFGGPFHPAGG